METVLAMDIGAGTQDLLLFEKGIRIENCIKLVLPTRAMLLARQVEELTRAGLPVFLDGTIMGSRFLATAVKKHIQAGYHCYATPLAAKTFRDNLEQVQASGVEIGDRPPHEMPVLRLGDIDLEPVHHLFQAYDKPLPAHYVIAVQDHGECLEGSNRKVRFEFWRDFLESGGELKSLLFREIPSLFTRMKAVRDVLHNSFLMDTGAAALMGSLYDPVVNEREPAGVILINVGNQHTLAALVKEGRVLGLLEHHTSFMEPNRVKTLIERFRMGELSNEEVFEAKGHGCIVHKDYLSGSPYEFVSVTGPQRFIAHSCGYHQAAPYGDMMLTGCFGLLGAAGFLE